MNHKKINPLLALLLLLNLESINAQVRLPRLVRDSMILQRDTQNKYLGLGCKE